MRKFLYFLVVILTIFSCSSYDDAELWDSVNDLSDRIDELETNIISINSDIVALQVVVNAVDSDIYVISTEQIEGGYRITFDNGESIEIFNGSNGSDAAIVSAEEYSDGNLYWAIVSGDGYEWLLDSSSQMIRVSGEDGVTPTIGIDDNGYWTLDMGDGVEQILDSNGDPILAIGSDGVSLFESVTEYDSYIVITLSTGSSYTLYKTPVLSISFATTDFTIEATETKDFEMILTEVVKVLVIETSDGWSAEVDGTVLRVTAPDEIGESGEVTVLVADSDGNCKIATLSLTTSAPTIVKVLSFEDSDYVGGVNYLGQSSWSSLIDPDQRYEQGALLYGTATNLLSDPFTYYIYNTDYQWYDQNNTELASKFVESEYDLGTNYKWGGVAISNYTELSSANADIDHQLSVPYVDVTTGYGGNGGSENFAMVHCGTNVEVSDYQSGSYYLTSIYFKDGEPRVINSLYIIPNAWLLSFMKGNDGTTISSDDYITIDAVGYDKSGGYIGYVSIDLLKDGAVMISSWTEWELLSLGEIYSLKFNMRGSMTNSYGFSAPAYFGIDDIEVAF